MPSTNRRKKDAPADASSEFRSLARQVFLLKMAAVALVALIFVGQWSDRHQEPNQFVIAQRLTLIDPSGRQQAVLFPGQGGARLELNDGNGDVRLVLDVSRTGPGLTFLDSDGKAQLVLAAGQNGPILAMTDARGERIITVPEEDSP